MGMDSENERDLLDGLLPIDNTGAANGLITEHLTRDERVIYSERISRLGGRPIRTLCGRDLYMVQGASGNSECRRCHQIARAQWER